MASAYLITFIKTNRHRGKENTLYLFFIKVKALLRVQISCQNRYTSLSKLCCIAAVDLSSDRVNISD